MKQVIPYYVRGHTAEGLVNFVDSNLKDIQDVYVVNHPSNQVISDVLSKILNNDSEAMSFEKIYSPYLSKGLEGIILRESSSAILAADVMKDRESSKYKQIDLTKWIPTREKEEEIRQLLTLQKKAYEQFSKALHIHDKLEKIYIDEMNFVKADSITDELIKEMFKHVPKRVGKAHIYERLFGTNTMDGALNKVPELIESIKHRVYVKGRAGTGKSVLLKKVIDQSMAYGYDVELYRCSFDPNSVDMVIIRELDYCLFDSTAPHEFFPSRVSDQVIDLYADTVTAGTDEKYEAKIKEITLAYKAELQSGLAQLHQLSNLSMFQQGIDKGNAASYEKLLDQVAKEILE